MNPVSFAQGGCEKVRKYLDSYISNELLVETNHEVLRHLESCSDCRAELDARTRVRDRLRTAVKSQAVPPELQVRIREQLNARDSRGWQAAGWTRWAAAMAATALVAAGVWLGVPRDRLPELSDRAGQTAYIQKVSARVATVLRVGLGDHIHCSIFRKYPQNPPTPEQMADKLGPAFEGLLPVVRSAVPEGYRVIMAHECGYDGRKYIHLTMERDGSLLSLVIARKQDGESMEGLKAAGQSSSVTIYQAGAGRYQVAGFDAGKFLAYVVSDLKSDANLQIATSLAPGVHEFLLKS